MSYPPIYNMRQRLLEEIRNSRIANHEQRVLLVKHEFIAAAWALSTLNEGETVKDFPYERCGVVADLLEENGHTEHAKLFRPLEA